MLLKRRRERRCHGTAPLVAAYCPRYEEEDEEAGSKHLLENDFGEKGILF